MTVEELSNKSHITIEKENAELKEQIEQLSNDNHVLKTSFITQQEQIENLEKDKEQIIFESDLKIKALEDHIEKLEAESSSKDECIDNLEYQLKDAGGELELWQRENAELKKTNALLYEQEKEKIKLIEKMKNCLNCATGQEPLTREKVQFCSSCRGLDEQKENIIYKYWKLAE